MLFMSSQHSHGCFAMPTGAHMYCFTGMSAFRYAATMSRWWTSARSATAMASTHQGILGLIYTVYINYIQTSRFYTVCIYSQIYTDCIYLSFLNIWIVYILPVYIMYKISVYILISYWIKSVSMFFGMVTEQVSIWPKAKCLAKFNTGHFQPIWTPPPPPHVNIIPVFDHQVFVANHRAIFPVQYFSVVQIWSISAWSIFT